MERIQRSDETVFVNSSINPQKLNRMASIPQTEETILLYHFLVKIVHGEMFLEGSSESVVIVVARNSVVSKFRFDLL